LPAIEGPTEVYALGHPVVVVPLADGLFAIDGRCPHRGGPLAQGKLEGCALRCPWHGFKYDVRTGQPVWPDGWDPAPVYAARVRDGLVELLVASLPDA
jgi:nitrite reductase/ring-hydroxylating ferredoxin subunit